MIYPTTRYIKKLYIVIWYEKLKQLKESRNAMKIWEIDHERVVPKVIIK